MHRRWLTIASLAAVFLLGLACGGPTGGEEALDELPPESPFTWALLMSWAALTLGGGSAVLGIWIDRDRSRPMVFALAMTGLISTAMCVGALQGYLDEEGAIATRAELERMLEMTEEIAAASGDPELAALVESKSTHRRARPRPNGAAGGGERGRKAREQAPPTEAPAPAEPAAEAPVEPSPPAEEAPPAPETAPGGE